MAKKLSKMEQMKLTKAKRAGETLEQAPSPVEAGAVVSIGGQDGGKKAERRMIMTSQIAYNENNDYSRLDTPEDIRSLAENIKQNGLEHNLVVVERQSGLEADKRFVLLSGERRLRAIRYVQENEDPTFYPEVACYVIPQSEFVRPAGVEMSDEEYRYRVEMIKLDTANLQSRGGTGNSTQTTKAMNRYKENVMAAYGKSEREANAQLLSIVGDKNKRFFERSQQLYRNLLPELYALYVDRETDLPQQDFLRLTSFGEAEQGKIYEVAKQLSFKKEELGRDYDLYRSRLREVLNRYGENGDGDTARQLGQDCQEILTEVNDSVARNQKQLRYQRAVDTIRIAEPGLERFFTDTDSPFSREDLIAITEPSCGSLFRMTARTAINLSVQREILGESYGPLVARLRDSVCEAAADGPGGAEELAADITEIEREAEAIVKEAKRKATEQGRLVLGVSAKEQRIRARSEKLKKSFVSLTEAVSGKDIDRFTKQICANREEAEDMLEKLDMLTGAIEKFRTRLMEAQSNG